LRLLLDAQLSPRRIGSALARRGHDVVSLAADPTLGSLDDPEVLELAARERRILVARNARDFAPLLREWAETDRHHAGCILIWTLDHHEFAKITTAIDSLLRSRPDDERWIDLALAI
jgi:Domain of unknown function (DUF5615)